MASGSQKADVARPGGDVTKLMDEIDKMSKSRKENKMRSNSGRQIGRTIGSCGCSSWVLSQRWHVYSEGYQSHPTLTYVTLMACR